MRLAPAVVLALLATVALCPACTPIAQPDRDAASELADWQPPTPGDPFPAFELRDGAGGVVNNASLRGRAAVITFVSLAADRSNAGSRLIMERMAELPARVTAGSPRLLAIRLTPADGPVPEAIEVLSGSDNSIRDLAASLAIVLDRVDGAWLHGYATTVLDPEGKIVAVLRGHSEWDAARLAAAVAGAVAR
jgi:cytochrome oxidase Cu insertion factor (SCO1/SenC/PrrC family)